MRFGSSRQRSDSPRGVNGEYRQLFVPAFRPELAASIAATERYQPVGAVPCAWAVHRKVRLG